MSYRGVETKLAWLSILSVIVYFPLETWYSLSWGLIHPMYVVDLIAMGLLSLGGWHSLRSRPRPAPALLCAAWGFAACLAYRSYFGRWLRLRETGELNEPGAVMPVLAVALVVAFAGLLLCIFLATRPDEG